MKSSYLNPNDFYSSAELTENYKNYIKESSLKKINLGFPIIDGLTRGIRSKEVMTLIAETGIGKSALTQNILMQHSRTTQELTLYFTLEMSSEEIFERMIQIELKVSGYEVENNFQANDEKFINACKEIAFRNKDFVLIEKRIDINRLNEVVTFLENHFKRKAGLICIDHLLLMENFKLDGNEYLKVSDNMRKIKSYSLESKIPFIIVSQISRNNSRTGIDLFAGKGSGEVENSSNFVLGLSKITLENCDDYALTERVVNEFDSKHINLLSLNLLKNRRGRAGNCILEMNRKTLEIYESALNKD
ncbi:MAG TPA: DnaB-like helicase C-terminal domain-containing protein [Ignavibacteria bacterium]|nr:DnaB-like helicase C-terminal domain-containing protein [Ignavibacteria bacterium]HMR41560.1 DnaB-like helicase C-terminal domain-containing protein [Ignavibacteria bacterium]